MIYKPALRLTTIKYLNMDRIMPTSKSDTHTITKIELDAIPPSFSSSALFCYPTRNAACNPAGINIWCPKLSFIEIDPLIPEDHESCVDYPQNKELCNEHRVSASNCL